MSEKRDEQINENFDNLHENENEQLHEQEQELINKEDQNDPIVKLEDKLTEVNDKYLRLYSDFENFRKRTAREKIDLITSGNAALLLKVLPVVDDFERAIESNSSIEDSKKLKEGFQLIFNKMKNILDTEGVKEMKSNGEAFDVEFHEAITRIPAPEKSLIGKVVDTTEKGYYLNDNVLRYAKVVVGS